jgi:gamma-glutamylcyclotransferase (GGCT)/AIG2-like uncharacterized protein YtfP
MNGFNLFVYGTLRSGSTAGGMLEGCRRVGEARLNGLLYDIDGRFPALLLYGGAQVHGEVWRCPAALLPRLDAYEGTGRGLFRRVGAHAEADGELVPCWVYTAGPALGRRLRPEHRIPGGRWMG